MQELYEGCFNVLNTELWIVAIYVRLSREDEKDINFKGQSESIENQIKFLKRIVKNKGWQIYDIYIDDGYTGTNFNRPGFQKMMNDIDDGKVNLVITKDLSRLGRDYIETGRYVEKVFPSKNIRYIAVNDNVDTFDKKNTNNDMTPFKSVINDMYAKDISNKVRTAMYTKAQDGECIKSFLPYGYKKDKNDKNKILIDDMVADNVRKIFELYKSGYGKAAIARTLNESNIITPLKYKEQTTNYFNPNISKMSTYKWNSTVITKILKDPIYVGDFVQLKYTKVNYKVKKTIKVPENEQIIKRNHHPAIIDRETFNTVQEMLEKQMNEWNYYSRKKHLLSGIVFCKCGGRVSYNLNHGKYSRCICSSYKKYGNKYCSIIHLKEEDLLKMVAQSLKKNINKYFNSSKVKIRENSSNEKQERNKIKQYEIKIEETNRLIANLYEDKISGIISAETFSVLVKKYENQKKEFDNKIREIKRKENDNEIEKNNINKIEDIMKEILKFDTINEENRSLVFKLIDRIIIDDNQITINYKFSQIS